MRTLIALERAQSQAARLTAHLKVEVQNGSGTWKDVGALLGADYVVGGGWGESIDQAVSDAQFKIRRKVGPYSLSPLLVASALNVDDTSAYAPLLDIGRLVRASSATLFPGLAPSVNSALQSATLGSAPWGNTATTAQNAVGLDGLANSATTVTDGSAVAFQDRTQNVAITNDSASHTMRMWLKMDAVASRAPQVRLVLSGGTTVQRSVSLNTQTGQFVGANVVGVGSHIVEDGALYGNPGWWVATISCQNNSTGNVTAALTLYPAARTTFAGADDATATGSVVVGNVNLHLNTTTAGGAIITTTAARSDYKEGVTGRIDAVAWESDPITISCSDLGAWLMDTQIEVEGTQYGTTPVGTALETVIQNILNANPSGKGVPALYTPTSPGYLVTAWAQGRTKVLDAIRAVTLQSTGWDVRFRYDPAHVSRLTLLDPQRSRVTVDTTIAASEYRDVKALSVSLANVRNVGKLPYTDAAGVYQSAVYPLPVNQVTDPSVVKYGRRYFELASSNAITTSTQANALIAAVVNDLSGAPAEQEILTSFLWFVQLYDRYTFTANGVHYDQDQTLGVVGYRHEFGDGVAWTTLRCTGKIVGAYADWLRAIVAGSAVDASLANGLRDVQYTFTDTDAPVTFAVGSAVTEVWAAYKVVPPPGTASDFSSLPGLLMPLPTGTTTFVVPRPADNSVVVVLLQPFNAGHVAGRKRCIIVTATPQPPVFDFDDVETPTVGTEWVKVIERGLRVSGLQAQTQVETNAFSAFAAPTRGPGQTSLVKGGTLNDLEYEQDVPLSAIKGRRTWIRFGTSLEGGAPIMSPDFSFDAGRAPAIDMLTSAVAIITGQGDSDVKSWKVTSGAWSRAVDGRFLTMDVSLADDAGTAGLAANATGSYIVTAYNVPVIAQPTAPAEGQVAQTLAIYNGTGTGGTGGSPTATWVQVSASAPGTIGDDTLTIKFQATSVPAGWTVAVFIASPVPGAAEVNHTTELSPVPSGPSTNLTSYAYSTGYTQVNSGPRTKLITFFGHAELRDGSAVLKDSRRFSASWYTPSFV